MMGYDFASHVHDYVYQQLKQPQLMGHHGAIARIKSNPDKSKHLETATVQIYGIEVDFVNLRNEIYQQGSRIPTIVGDKTLYIICICHLFHRPSVPQYKMPNDEI